MGTESCTEYAHMCEFVHLPNKTYILENICIICGFTFVVTTKVMGQFCPNGFWLEIKIDGEKVKIIEKYLSTMLEFPEFFVLSKVWTGSKTKASSPNN